MILTRTPFRVTLGGGGTDLPAFYQRHGGHTLAFGLDKFMYVAVNRPVVGEKVRVNYTRNEVAEHPRQLRHQLARAALDHFGIERRIEITSMADLPAGTGLGSSSAYLVGLLKALHSFAGGRTAGDGQSPEQLAEEACALEIDKLHGPAGKHDAYMAAFGGLTELDIGTDGAVVARRLELSTSALADLIDNAQLYWTGLSQTPGQSMDYFYAMGRTESPSHARVMASLQAIKDVSYQIVAAIEGGDFDEFGRLMDVHWQHKTAMSAKIAIPGIAELYGELKERFGVLGGKVAGTGGGGFFMVYAPTRHGEVEQFLVERGLQRLRYGLDFDGARVLASSPGAHPATGVAGSGAPSDAGRDRRERGGLREGTGEA